MVDSRLRIHPSIQVSGLLKRMDRDTQYMGAPLWMFPPTANIANQERMTSSGPNHSASIAVE